MRFLLSVSHNNQTCKKKRLILFLSISNESVQQTSFAFWNERQIKFNVWTTVFLHLHILSPTVMKEAITKCLPCHQRLGSCQGDTLLPVSGMPGKTEGEFACVMFFFLCNLERPMRGTPERRLLAVYVIARACVKKPTCLNSITSVSWF